MRAAQVSLFRLSSCMAATWIALSGVVVRAEDLPPQADRITGKDECWFLLGKEKMPCGAVKVISPAILRQDGSYRHCVARMQAASGQIFDAPTCSAFCHPHDGPDTALCVYW